MIEVNMDTIALESAIESDFICYYQADELPNVWVDDRVGKDWTEAAPDSANRLLHKIGKEHAGELIDVLTRMRDHPEDPLVQEISMSTMTDWPNDPNDWRDFQDLLDRIIAIVRKETAPRP
jgi:hypothetical protein